MSPHTPLFVTHLKCFVKRSVVSGCSAGIPLGQVSIFLVAFIAFFFFAAIFTGNIGEI